jgi:ribosomal protein S18 acetylase RimI-like enzyme
MNFQIRLSKPEDSDKIIKLQTNSLRTLSVSYNSTQIESLIHSQTSLRFAPDEIGLVAEHNNDIVGFASFIVRSSQITGVYVHPDFMRQGIGTQLLETVEKIALDRGNKAIHVMSAMDAVNFYKAVGYKPTRRSGFYADAREWIPCIKLEKQIIVLPKSQKIYLHFVSLVSRLMAIFYFIVLMAVAALVFALLPLIISSIVSLF